MATYTKLSKAEAYKILTRFGGQHSSLALVVAEADPGSEYEVYGKPGHMLWLAFNSHPHPSISGKFTLTLCEDHDDEMGCCDKCGRWQSTQAKPAVRADEAFVADMHRRNA